MIFAANSVAFGCSAAVARAAIWAALQGLSPVCARARRPASIILPAAEVAAGGGRPTVGLRATAAALTIIAAVAATGGAAISAAVGAVASAVACAGCARWAKLAAATRFGKGAAATRFGFVVTAGFARPSSPMAEKRDAESVGADAGVAALDVAALDGLM
jgi:hypothetical protein